MANSSIEHVDGPSGRALQLCVFHQTMALPLARFIESCISGVAVRAVSETDRDPPGAAEIDALVAFRFPSGMLGRMPRLRWLQLTSTGFDQLAGGAPPPGLMVSHAGSVPARAVAEFVAMAVFAHARRAPTLVRQHDERRWAKPGARLVRGRTMVVLGLGRIGQEVARLALAVGMRVIGVTRSGQTEIEVERCVDPSRLEQVAADADYLAVCVPSDARTRGLVGREVLARIRSGCCLIDVSRPGVVDPEALLVALEQGRCELAVLDVHRAEPLPEHDPLWSAPGVWVTPHCAFEQDDEVSILGALVVDNLQRLLEGRPLRNLVVTRGIQG